MSKVSTPPSRPRWGVWATLGALSIAAVGGLAAFAWRPADPEAIWKHARAAFDARDFAGVEADLAVLGRLREPTGFDRMLRAQLAIAQGRVDDAIADLDKIPDDHQMAIQARHQVGQLELRRHRFVAAEAGFLKALALDPKMVPALRELIYIYGVQLRRPELHKTFRALSELSPLKFSDVFLWCLTRGVTWEPEENAKTLALCIDADPNDRWSRLGRADALRELNRFEEAEEVLAPLPDSDPDSRAARVRIALDQGDPTKAEALLESGPSDHLGLALLRGRLALVRNDGPEAVRQFRIAYEKAPNLREAVLGLGQSLQNVGDLAAATPILELARKHEKLGTLIQRAAVEANRSDPKLMSDLGDACAAIGRFPEARAWYNLAISRDPLDTRAQQGLARVRQATAPKPAIPAP